MSDADGVDGRLRRYGNDGTSFTVPIWSDGVILKA
jgi:hypothetical protein